MDPAREHLRLLYAPSEKLTALNIEDGAFQNRKVPLCFFVCFSNGRPVGTSGWGKGTSFSPVGRAIRMKSIHSTGCTMSKLPFLWKFYVWVRTAVVLKQEGQKQHLSNTPLSPGRVPAYTSRQPSHIKYQSTILSSRSPSGELFYTRCTTHHHFSILLLLSQSQDLCMYWYNLAGGTPVRNFSHPTMLLWGVTKIPITFPTSSSLSESNVPHQLLELRSKD